VKVIAIIPARGGSKGVPGKNKKIIDGKPLIAYTLEAAMQSMVFDRIVVSSDEEAILQIAKSYPGIELHHRPSQMATDQSPVIDTVLDIIKESDAEAVMLLQPTAPIRTKENILDAVKLLESNPDAGSVVSVVEMTDIHPARMYWKNGNFLAPVLGDYETVRRQDIPPAYYRNGSIYLVTVKAIREFNSLMPKPMLPYIMPFNWLLNIDEPRDILMAEALIPAWKKGLLG